MSNAMRRGGIPGPESRTGLTRPSMTEAEFERRIGTQAEITSSIESSDATRGRIHSAFYLRRFPTATSRTGQADQAQTGSTDVRHRGGPGQETLALRHPPGEGPFRGRQRLASTHRCLDGALRLARPPEWSKH